jgi:glycosyltransferase involved in cell wall biosynthesis
MNQPRVLVVCYYFPPMGGAGVTRPLALYERLGQFGLKCHVLTVKPVTYRVYEPELLSGLDTGGIYRSGSFDPQRLMYLLGMRKVTDKTIRQGRSVSERFFPDSKVGWVKPAVRLGRQLMANNNYGVVVSTSPPISAHLVARQLARESRLPWVADFRDFWTSYSFEEVFHEARMRQKAEHLLNQIKSEAAAVTTVNESLASYFGSAAVIANSFDLDVARAWQSPVKRDDFVIGLFGTFNNIYPIEPLLRLLAYARDTSPDLFARIRLLQVGNVDKASFSEQLARYGLLDRCRLHGFHPRREALKMLSEAAMFYIGLPSEKEKAFTTGRRYYRLASGRPLLAAVPWNSEIAKLVRESSNGFCFTDSTLPEGVSYLISRTEAWLGGHLNISPLPDYALEYTSEKMAGKFAHLLKSIIEKTRQP